MLSRRVEEALRRVPRERFIPRLLLPFARWERPFPIEFGQTISQPYVVGLMTELLGLGGGERVLEVGTGSGYQTAVLAELAAQVFTVERIPQLAERARETLAALGYANVWVRVGDGRHGWAEHAPFDRILVTAAPARVPGALVEQLREGGVMVVPLGEPGRRQALCQGFKEGGRLRLVQRAWVRFVPLVGEEEPGVRD